MELKLLSVDGAFDIANEWCIFAVIVCAGISGVLSYLIMQQYALTVENNKVISKKLVVRLAIIGFVVLLSSPLERILASLFATLDMHFHGTLGTVGFPWGFAPIWPSVATSTIAVGISLYRLKRMKANEVT